MIRRSWPLAIAAALFVGCNNESEQADEDMKGVPPDTTQTYAPDDAANPQNPGGTGVENYDPGYPEPNPKGATATPPTGAQANEDMDPIPESPVETPTGAPVEPIGAEPVGGEGPQASVTLSEEEIANIRKLPDEEADDALAQKVCPVSDEHLGSMGTPIKVTAEGETAYLCCEGCKADFEATPAKFLAEIGKDKE